MEKTVRKTTDILFEVQNDFLDKTEIVLRYAQTFGDESSNKFSYLFLPRCISMNNESRSKFVGK